MLSRQSGVFVFGGLITIAIGRLFGLIELFIMGTALITCVAVAILLVTTQKPNIEINRAVVPLNPEAGQIVEVELSLLTGSRIPACDVYETTEDGGRVHIPLAPLPSGQVARANYQIATHRRGSLILGPAIVEVADPLGLSRRSKKLGQSTQITVYPQSVEIKLPDPKTGTGELVEAIKKGIPFYFVTELQITRGRWYWFEEKLIQTNKNIRLSYQPLTQQYRISTEGFTYSANSISDALIQIGAIGGWQVADLAVLENGQTYQGAMRMRLDLTKLPKPFQINALNTRDWTVLSDWHPFTITPKARATK